MRENIQPTPLRELIYQQLLDRIVKGEIPPGGPIRDTEVSQTMGVSRTPVREALLRLSKEGLLQNRHHRGFVVSDMSPDVIRETYPIIWTLETLALKSLPAVKPARIRKLEKLNEDLENRSHDPVYRIKTDDAWHRELIADCPNRRLQSIIGEMKAVVLRYEYAYMGDVDLVRCSHDEHAAVIQALGNRGTDAAADLLIKHWQRSLDGLMARLEQANQPSKKKQGES